MDNCFVLNSNSSSEFTINYVVNRMSTVRASLKLKFMTCWQ